MESVSTLHQQPPNNMVKILRNILYVSLAAYKFVQTPIQLVRLRLQNSNALVKNGSLNEPYIGVINCIKKVYAEEGLRSFWKGALSNFLFYSSFLPIAFYFRGKLKEVLGKQQMQQYALQINLVVGSSAGIAALLLTYPMDYVRVRLSNDLKNIKSGRQKQFNGILNVWTKTIGLNGLTGVYRGFGISCFSAVIHRGLFFSFYDWLKRCIAREDKEQMWGILYGLGWAASLGGWLFFYPIDTLQKRIIMNQNVNVIGLAKQMFRTQGVKSFFRGSTLTIFQSSSAGISYVLYDRLELYFEYLPMKE